MEGEDRRERDGEEGMLAERELDMKVCEVSAGPFFYKPLEMFLHSVLYP